MNIGEELNAEIEKGILEILKLDSSQIIEVHKIYNNLFLKFKKLTSNDFVNTTHYQDFLKRRPVLIKSFEDELNDLLHNKSDLYTFDNFSQIRLSITKMITEKKY